jgi:hypothetical protein
MNTDAQNNYFFDLPKRNACVDSENRKMWLGDLVVRCKAKKENDSANLIDFLFCRPAKSEKPTYITHICKSHRPTHNQNLQKSVIFAITL